MKEKFTTIKSVFYSFLFFCFAFLKCNNPNNEQLSNSSLQMIKETILKQHTPNNFLWRRNQECLFKKYVELELDTSLIHFKQDLGVLKIANQYSNYLEMYFSIVKTNNSKFYYIERVAEEDCYFRYVLNQKHDTLAVKDYSNSAEIKTLNQILLDISKKQKVMPSKVEEIINAIYQKNTLRGWVSNFKYKINEDEFFRELIALKTNPPLIGSEDSISNYCMSLFQNPQLHTLMYKEKSGISITIFVVHKNPVPSVQMLKIPTAKDVFIPGADFKMGTQYKDCWDK